MASTEGPARAHDTHGRRRPFASWMKRLANLKSLHADSNQNISTRRSNISAINKPKKSHTWRNNPYPLSGRSEEHNGESPSFPAPANNERSRQISPSRSKHSLSDSHDGRVNSKSRAPTLATTADTSISEAATSGAATIATTARTDGDRNSTFSSPAHSLRSVATTLTTVQSIAAPNNNGTTANATAPAGTGLQFSSQPATAIPAHLAPHAHPTTYHSATANNVLTDDASILTLASSSKRRRRNSVDTNASVRALAPASMFGGSRESLPLSVLSGTVIHANPADAVSLRDTNSSAYPRSTLNAERISLISASGVTAPALASERNSYIGSKYGDAASVRSGLLGVGHGRNDSVSGSIGGGREGREYRDRERERERDSTMTPTSPLAEGITLEDPIATVMTSNSQTNDRNPAWAENHSIERESRE